MADIYVEHMVKRRVTPLVIATKVAIILAGIAGFFLILTLSPLLQGFAFLGLLLGIGVLVFAGWLFRGQSLEYEYTITNGEVDIDRIVARTSRKRMLNFHCRDVERLAPFQPGQGKLPGKVVAACSHPQDDNVWCCTVKGSQPMTLVFNPNQAFLDAMKRFLPGAVSRDAFRDLPAGEELS